MRRNHAVYRNQCELRYTQKNLSVAVKAFIFLLPDTEVYDLIHSQVALDIFARVDTDIALHRQRLIGQIDFVVAGVVDTIPSDTGIESVMYSTIKRAMKF